MKAKEFLTALRTLIREEVRAAVKQELTEALQKRPASKPTGQRVEQRKPQPTKKYSGNSILDQVLNETRLTSDFNQSTTVDFDEMSFTSDQVPAPAYAPTSMIDMLSADDDAGYEPVTNTESLPFMKDYSKLLQRADQISTQKSF